MHSGACEGTPQGEKDREGVEVNRQYAGASPSGGDKKVDIYGNLEKRIGKRD